MRNIIYSKLRNDPVAAYIELRRIHREEKIAQERKMEGGPKPEPAPAATDKYLQLVESLLNALEKTELIALAKPHLREYKEGSRGIYHSLFNPLEKPDFMFTRLMAAFPLDGEEIDSYTVRGTDVTIFKLPSTVQYLYHIVPPEFKLSEDKYEILDAAKRIISEHKPTRSEFIDPERVRQVFFNVGSDLIEELSGQKQINLRAKETEELAEILVRYTIGFGLIEVLLKDDKIQDIAVNSPMGRQPIFIVHQDYDDCMTNIIPTISDGDSWATKLRLMSGRPLDEANPIMDTELILPDARARVAVVGEPLNPNGLAYAFRRHRDKPWTIPLFIKNRMMTPLSGGLLSFVIDGARTMLVAGTRSAGKSSLLGAMMVEVMRKYRIISIEDTLELPISSLRQIGYNIQPLKVASALSKGTTEVPADEGIRTTLRMGDSCLIIGEVRSSIRGDQEVVVVEKGICKRVPIKDLENKDVSDYLIPTLDFDLKTNLRRLTAFVKHPPREKLLEVRTKTGRSVTVTPDHSLFTATKELKIVPIECKDLKKGSQVVIPASIPYGFNDVDEINLLEEVPELRVENFEPPVREEISKIGWKKATEICGIKSGDIYNYFRTNQKTNMPVASFKELMEETNTHFSTSQLLIKTGTSNSIPAVVPVNEDFCSYLGYYVSEGYCELRQGGGGKVIITNSDERVLNHVSALTKELFNITPRKREVFGAGRSVQLIASCKPLAEFLLKIRAGKFCTEKRVPPLIYGMSKKKIAAFLRALYEGDGSMTVSESSGNSIRYYTTSQKLAEDVAYLLLAFKIVARIYPAKKREKSNQLWVVEFKDRKMVETFMREIGFVYKNKKLQNKKWAHTKASTVYLDKAVLKQNLVKYPRKYRHLLRFLRCSKNYLERVVNDPECAVTARLKIFAEGDFYLDEVEEIKELFLPEPEPVYDLSVSPSQNFVGGFGGILLHNTEALALYEAMRVGALANFVAGTIHGDSPYGVFDRVVNDLKVPRTSFKATDIVVVANPIRSADGLHRWRRVTQITEVGKYWENDPSLEKGFKDLMKYDSKSDKLEPTLDLLNGESDILKSVAANVKEWAGSWDAVWDNIMLRTQIKEALVNAAEKTGQDDILEAPFVVHANDEFHKIAEETKEELGAFDSRKIFFEWNEWL
ncbi:MAG: ATPase, T2SS/T4P/T4SS family, partial [Nanoarchaeota archaeon]